MLETRDFHMRQSASLAGWQAAWSPTHGTGAVRFVQLSTTPSCKSGYEDVELRWGRIQGRVTGRGATSWRQL